MNLISSFITHSVQPGTSFSDTPTLNMFKELCNIARRYVARAPPRSARKMKRVSEHDDHTAHSDHFQGSASNAQSDIYTMTSFVSTLQINFERSIFIIT